MKTIILGIISIFYFASSTLGAEIAFVDKAFVYYFVIERDQSRPISGMEIHGRVDPPFAVRPSGITGPRGCFTTYGAMTLDGAFTVVMLCPSKTIRGPLMRLAFTGTRPVDAATVNFEKCVIDEVAAQCPISISLIVK